MAEQELRASESRYRQLFESASDAIFILTDGLIVDCNNKALDLFDSSPEAIVGVSPIVLSTTTQADGRSSEVQVVRRNAMVRGGVPQFFEWRFRRKDASRFDAEVSQIVRSLIIYCHKTL